MYCLPQIPEPEAHPIDSVCKDYRTIAAGDALTSEECGDFFQAYPKSVLAFYERFPDGDPVKMGVLARLTEGRGS